MSSEKLEERGRAALKEPRLSGWLDQGGRGAGWAWGGRCGARGGEVAWASEGRCRAGGGRAWEGRSKDTGGVRPAGTPGPQWTVPLALGNKPHERATWPLTAPFRPLCPAEAPREPAGAPDRGCWVALAAARHQDSAWTQAPAVASWLSTAGQVTSSPSVFSQAPGRWSADRGHVTTSPCVCLARAAAHCCCINRTWSLSSRGCSQEVTCGWKDKCCVV